MPEAKAPLAEIAIPAREARVAEVEAGDVLRIIDPGAASWRLRGLPARRSGRVLLAKPGHPSGFAAIEGAL
jgi:hypothetical protein